VTGQLAMTFVPPPPPPQPITSDTLPVPTRALAAFAQACRERGDKATANAIGTALRQATTETIPVSRALVERWGLTE